MNAGESDSAFRALERNGQFHTYLNRQIMTVRQQAQSTGGLQELLAEPFQRISRYRLMIDRQSRPQCSPPPARALTSILLAAAIIRHLPQSDPNIPALQEAVEKLSEVCSMETDEGTKRTAEMWALMHTIQGFPSALIAYRSRQFLGCVDADEIVDSPTGSYDLRCCIFLFSDKLVLAKRPPGTKGARQLTGIDNNDSLVQQFKAAQRPQAEVSLLAAGTPRKNDGGKIKKDAMGFRGAVELLEVRAVDLGPAEFGLVFEQPPADQNERWRGRPTRRYQIASSCGAEDRVAEKRSWLAKVEEAQAQRRISFGAPGVRRSAPVPARGEGSSGEQKETVVYWTVWDRDSWEDAGKAAKAQLALHIDEDGDAHDLTLGRPGGGPPQIVARASLVGGDGCRSVERPCSVSRRCADFILYFRFSVRSTSATPSQAERIGLDRITPAIAEIGLSYGLCSFPARTAPDSPTTNRPRPRSFLNSSINGALDFIGAGSLKRGDSKTSRVSSATTTSRYTGFSNSLSSATAFSPRQLIGKKSAPELYGSSRHRASKSVSALGNGLLMDEEDEDRLEQSTARPYGLPTRAETEPPAEVVPTGSIAKRPTRHRRSLSMPQQPTLDALAAPEPVEEEPETDPLRPPSPEPLADSRPHTAMSWLPEDEPLAQVQTSPIAYRAPSKNGRRLMGPRAPGATPSSATRQSDYGSPFDRRREDSPAPAGYREDYSPAPETPSKADEDQFIDRPASAGYKRTGAEAMSPRKSPAKKASVYGADGSAFGTPARGLSGVSPLSITRRAPSSGVRLPSGRVRIPSDGSARRRASRIASGASTVRAGSPTPLAEGKEEEEEDRMDEDREVEGPVTRLKEHVKALKGALVQDGVGKENTGLIHRPTLSRSPHTRDVHLKMTNKSSSYASAFSAAKARTPSSTAGPDPAFLLRWTEELNSLVEECADLGQQPSATLPSGPSLTEMLTLEAERDVLQAELASCQAQVAALSSANSTLQSDLATTQAQLSEQQNLYSHALKMIDNVQLLWDELDQIDAEGAAIDHPVAKLQARAAREMKARTEAEHKLGMMELERAKERAKVERYEAVLREHGLI